MGVFSGIFMQSTHKLAIVFLAFFSCSITNYANQSNEEKEKAAKALENAVTIYEQFTKTGSASALNQIAAAYFTLGEQNEINNCAQKAQEFYQKAVVYFCKAAEAGCIEAKYNAGIAYNKLKTYDKAALCYRECIKHCSDNESDLALKAAVNLMILVLENNVPRNVDEIISLVKLSEMNKQNPKAEELLQTSVAILTDINATTKQNTSAGKELSDSIDGISATKTCYKTS
ncbi:MAG: hypothetical protein LBD36_02290 [Holosporales bacterium]|nr:hypothetical protein [Holosporales bacterium]